jgi:hypothetical protein
MIEVAVAVGELNWIIEDPVAVEKLRKCQIEEEADAKNK